MRTDRFESKFGNNIIYIDGIGYVRRDGDGTIKLGDIKMLDTGEVIKNPSLLWLGHLGKLERAYHPDNAIVIKGGD